VRGTGGTYAVSAWPAPAISDQADPIRKVAFQLGVCLLFLRVSNLHQVLVFLTGVNLRLLYVVGLPALLGVLVGGGVKRAFRGRPTYYWAGFSVWMTLAVPFSIYIRGSLNCLEDFLRTDLIMLFAIAGLATNWRECKQVMQAIGWGAVVNVSTASLFFKSYGDVEYGARFGLEFGSIANPNDFAAVVLFSLPFLLWFALSWKFLPFRLAALAGVAFGIYLILATASRGAALGLIAATGLFVWRGTAKQRIAMVMAVPILVGVLIVKLPKSALDRITSLADSVSTGDIEKEQRGYLLRKSIEYTFQFPIFGVGPGEFSWYEGTHNVIGGTTHGSWHGAHNTFTEVSSECGIPGALFFFAAIVSTYRLLKQTYRRARDRADCQDIKTATLCVLVSMAGFCTAVFFLNFAYLFYLPALSGLAISVNHAAEVEFESRAQASPARSSANDASSPPGSCPHTADRYPRKAGNDAPKPIARPAPTFRS
jgi:hypothetical protein